VINLCPEPPNPPIRPAALAVAFLKAGDFEECFPDLSVLASQGRRLMGNTLG